MPVSAILGLVAEISDGFYLPEGGMGQIPRVLSCASQIRGMGVFLNSKVEKIIVKDGRVRAVKINGGGQVDAAAVISTASGMLTFGSLIGAEHVPSAIVRRLKHPRLSRGLAGGWAACGIGRSDCPACRPVSCAPKERFHPATAFRGEVCRSHEICRVNRKKWPDTPGIGRATVLGLVCVIGSRDWPHKPLWKFP